MFSRVGVASWIGQNIINTYLYIHRQGFTCCSTSFWNLEQSLKVNSLLVTKSTCIWTPRACSEARQNWLLLTNEGTVTRDIYKEGCMLPMVLSHSAHWKVTCRLQIYKITVGVEKIWKLSLVKETYILFLEKTQCQLSLLWKKTAMWLSVCTILIFNRFFLFRVRL